MKPFLLAPLLFFAACGKYESFRLEQPQGQATPVRWEWEESAGTSPLPVLAFGKEGAFDDTDALNPSTVFWTPPNASGRWLNLYSGFDGKAWHSGLAESNDLRQWTKQGIAISPDPATWEGNYIAANGAVTTSADGHKLLYWYQAGTPPQIGLATSVDGRQWTKLPNPVLPLGPRGSWDERGVGDPYIVKGKEFFYLFFLGQDRARRQRLGVARSRDGITWTKLVTNPILELGELGSFDALGLGEPAVWSAFGKWWMLYTGRDAKENRRMGLAESTDGITWKRSKAEPLFAGTQTWNSRVVCDADVLPQPDGTWLVLYGGGDRPEPAENLHGQIGLGRLRAIPAGQ